jgi:hypothetical protein
VKFEKRISNVAYRTTLNSNMQSKNKFLTKHLEVFQKLQRSYKIPNINVAKEIKKLREPIEKSKTHLKIKPTEDYSKISKNKSVDK